MIIMATIGETVAWLRDFGIFQFFLPFILMFAIFYGLLLKTKIFGDTKEKPARTISMIISLAASAYILIFTPAGVTISGFLSNLFGRTMMVVLSILAFLMVFFLLMNVLQPGATWNWSKWGWAALLVAIILGIGLFISSGGRAIFPNISLNFNIDPGILAVILVVVLTGLVIYFLASSDSSGLEISRR